MSDAASARPTLAVWKFASCDGCQLSLLDCEAELLALTRAVRIAHFTEMSRATVAGPYDVSLVEGSITTAADVERIKDVRAASRTPHHHRGVRGRRRDPGPAQLRRAGPPTRASSTPTPSTSTTSVTSTPISAHVQGRLRAPRLPDRPRPAPRGAARPAGRSAPGDRGPLGLPGVQGARHGVPPGAGGTPCLGPVTRAGCGALCPASAGAASGASGRARGPTRASLVARLVDGADAGDGTAVRDLQRGRARLPRPVRARGRPRPGRPDAASEGRRDPRPQSIAYRSASRACPASRARARCASRCATGSRDVALDIFEPPRFFEAMLVGRHVSEAPDITARICGICPVAYQMAACAAMEDACGVTVDERISALRRLLYCGEWIQSHALHVYLLHAPGLPRLRGRGRAGRAGPAAVERGLQTQAGRNLVMETVGGRAVHPVNVRVGGLLPGARPRGRRGAGRARCAGPATTRWRPCEWVAGFDFPDVRATTASWRCATATATPSSAAGRRRPTAWT